MSLIKPSFSHSFLKRLIICWTDSPARDLTFSIKKQTFLCFLYQKQSQNHNILNSSKIVRFITLNQILHFFKSKNVS
jgi:hypothetical protein